MFIVSDLTPRFLFIFVYSSEQSKGFRQTFLSYELLVSSVVSGRTTHYHFMCRSLVYETTVTFSLEVHVEVCTSKNSKM